LLALSITVRFAFAVKPGRKLIDQGASSCTDAELLAIIFGSGGRGYSALDAAHAVLERYGTLSDLMDRPLEEIANIRGIKTVRAIRLAAAYELCQRLLQEVDRNA
jgi:DNA repair protein RadC